MVNENQTEEALVFAERTKARVLLDVLQQGLLVKVPVEHLRVLD